MPRSKNPIQPPQVIIHPGHGGQITSLNNNDVISGRGGKINNHSGNVTYRELVAVYKHEYLDPNTKKLEKVHVAARLVAQIRSSGGRFLKVNSDNLCCFIEIGDQMAWKSKLILFCLVFGLF